MDFEGLSKITKFCYELAVNLGFLDVSDMMQTFWRLITNPTLMCNNLASVFYFLGYMPYWVFMAKYIETQYRQSASTSSLVTGTVQSTSWWAARDRHEPWRLAYRKCKYTNIVCFMLEVTGFFKHQLSKVDWLTSARDSR